jgi:hypothetical protein
MASSSSITPPPLETSSSQTPRAEKFMVSASISLSRLLAGSEIDDNIGHELYKLVRNPPSNNPTQETPSAITALRHKSTTDCPFLDILPPEMRDEIYKYLLVNLVLGQSEVGYDVCDPVRFSLTPVKYNLETSIIYTCRKVSEEALKMLYRANTFYLCCFEQSESQSYGPYPAMSPLLRYQDSKKGNAVRPLTTQTTFRKCVDGKSWLQHSGILGNFIGVDFPLGFLQNFARS